MGLFKPFTALMQSRRFSTLLFLLAAMEFLVWVQASTASQSEDVLQHLRVDTAVRLNFGDLTQKLKHKQDEDQDLAFLKGKDYLKYRRFEEKFLEEKYSVASTLPEQDSGRDGQVPAVIDGHHPGAPDGSGEMSSSEPQAEASSDSVGSTSTTTKSRDASSAGDSPQCVTSGILTEKGKQYLVVASGPPKKPSPALSLCTGFSESACCTHESEQWLAAALQGYEVLFGACPACMDNLRHTLCAAVCAPTQAAFVTATTATVANTTVAASLHAALAPAYATALLDSCADVSVAAAHTSILRGLNVTTGPGLAAWLSSSPAGRPLDLALSVSATGSFADTGALAACADSCACANCAAACAAEGPHCIMYGADSVHFKRLSKVYSGPAIKPSEPLSICQQYSEGACCSVAQAQYLHDQMMVARSLFGVCPSCIDNMIAWWCAYTCAPNQSEFLGVKDTLEFNGTRYVNHTSFAVSLALGQAIWDSCKDVQMASTGMPVFAKMGVFNATQMLRFEAEYPGAPYPIDIAITDTASLNLTFAPMESCAEKCSCHHCAAACPVHEEGQWDDPSEISTRTLFEVVLVESGILLVLVLVLVFGLGFFCIAGVGAEPPLDKHDKPKSAVRKVFSGDVFNDALRRLGKTCARHPLPVLAISLLLTAALVLGILRLQVVTDPIKLWVPASSSVLADKHYFDDHFGAFYRIEQVIFKLPASAGNASIINRDTLVDVIKFQEAVHAITAYTDADPSVPITISDICFKPLQHNESCIVQSVSGYWQGDWRAVNTTANVTAYVENCLQAPLSDGCRDQLGIPVDPNVVFGGFDGDAYLNSTALVVTWLMQNEVANVPRAEAWEKEFLVLCKKGVPGLVLDFSSERSVQDELSRETTADIPTIVISYSLMFAYLCLSLGSYFPLGTVFVRSRLMVAFAGIVIVILSVLISMGVVNAFGMQATLIISEVIPFLVLAIGSDNVFLLVSTYDMLENKVRRAGIALDARTVRKLMGETFSRVAPSIITATLSQVLGFAIGSAARMPAVQAFCVYAAVAILCNTVLELTAFSCILALDCLRQAESRLDLCPCVVVESADSKRPKFGFIRTLLKKYVGPYLLHPFSKLIVMLSFIAMFSCGLFYCFRVPQGLDQKVTMPSNSYLIDYFDDVANVLHVGPPVYYVIRGSTNYSDPAVQNKLCTISSGPGRCLANSLGNEALEAGLVPWKTHLEPTFSSWVDDYLMFLTTPGCCRMRTDNTTFCPATFQSEKCYPCIPENLFDANRRPPSDLFMKFIPFFMEAECSASCTACGTPYVDDLSFARGDPTDIVATKYRGYHTPMRNQTDFINGMKFAYNLTDYLSDSLGLDIYPYSSYYVFFEQYFYIEGTLVLALSLATAIVFCINVVMLRSVLMALASCLVVCMVEVEVLAVMYWWDVSLNALSTVNLIMGVGLIIEFCVHICHGLQSEFIEWKRQWHALKEPLLRAENGNQDFNKDGDDDDHDNDSSNSSGDEGERPLVALSPSDRMVCAAYGARGSCVLSGIFLTKLIGVCVLAFAHSQVFRVYYFRMYLAIIVLAGLHSMLFLPVLLSYIAQVKFWLLTVVKVDVPLLL